MARFAQFFPISLHLERGLQEEHWPWSLSPPLPHLVALWRTRTYPLRGPQFAATAPSPFNGRPGQEAASSPAGVARALLRSLGRVTGRRSLSFVNLPGIPFSSYDSHGSAGRKVIYSVHTQELRRLYPSMPSICISMRVSHIPGRP